MAQAEMDTSADPRDDRFSAWYGFDTENDENGQITLTAMVSESGERWVWKGQGHFVRWCDRQTKGSPIVICHNLEYDLVNEFGIDLFSQMQLNYLKGRLISAKYKRVSFRDSFNHFRMPLREIGNELGIPKLAYDINNPDYVSQDAWICLKVMTQARDYIAGLGGQIGATSGSSAMSIWRYMTEDEFVTGPIDSVWLRKGYYGGRTEIFRYLTEGVIRGYDVNSMYPFCMLYAYPEYLMDDPHFTKAKGMVECTVSIPRDISVAPLPYRTGNDQLWYPVGTFRGVWTYDEVQQALAMGGKVIKVHKATGCNTLIKPFTQFVETLYAKRKASTNKAERLFLKVLMNALYGKVASKNQVTRTVSRFNLMKKENPRLEEVKWINYHRGLLDYFTPQQPYVNVCWGSMITAYSRLTLLRHMLTVPPEKLIYCDTDSCYCVNHEMAESAELGGMKLEKTASRMKVVQPKAYMLDDEYLAKGVPRPKKDDDGNIIIDYARQYIEEGFTEFQAPIRFRASLNSHRGRANQWVRHVKSRRTAYGAKTLSDNRYYPPIVGHQLELAVSGGGRKPKKDIGVNSYGRKESSSTTRRGQEARRAHQPELGI